jgi:hypothetical protein
MFPHQVRNPKCLDARLFALFPLHLLDKSKQISSYLVTRIVSVRIGSSSHSPSFDSKGQGKG